MFRHLLPLATLVVGPLVGPTTSAAVTRHVPGEYATIQSGLDASASGDSVLVAPGTYTHYSIRDFGEPFDWTACVFMTDGVVLRSEAGAAATVIDAHLMNGPQPIAINARFMAGDETAIEGFTVTLAPTGSRGAYLLGRLTFRDCIFRDLDVGQSSGGGIAANGNLTLIGCVFDDCRAHNGGAIYHANGWIEMFDCVVRDCGNVGVLCAGNSVPPVESSHIEGCTFEQCFNMSAGGGGLHVSSHYGGTVIRGCRFVGNEGGSSGGAGLYLGALGPGSIVEDCLFLSNRAIGPNGLGGGIKATSSLSAVTVRRCTFWGNFAPTVSGGEAVALGGLGSRLENNVIAGSIGPAGAVYVDEIPLISTCNVFWENEGGLGVGYTPGPTDRIVDPLFCDVDAEDFTVRVDSPCIPPGSVDCGQIGNFGPGCGTISVDAQSWSEIKGAYRAP